MGHCRICVTADSKSNQSHRMYTAPGCMNEKFVNIGKEGVKQLLLFFSLRLSGVGEGIFSISPTKWDVTKVPYNDV